MKYRGGDDVMRSLPGHLAHLEECAKRWERDGQPDQAANVRATAARIREEAKSTVPDPMAAHFKSAPDDKSAAKIAELAPAVARAREEKKNP